jgi:hypothetical protein
MLLAIAPEKFAVAAKLFPACRDRLPENDKVAVSARAKTLCEDNAPENDSAAANALIKDLLTVRAPTKDNAAVLTIDIFLTSVPASANEADSTRETSLTTTPASGSVPVRLLLVLRVSAPTNDNEAASTLTNNLLTFRLPMNGNAAARLLDVLNFNMPTNERAAVNGRKTSLEITPANDDVPVRFLLTLRVNAPIKVKVATRAFTNSLLAARLPTNDNVADIEAGVYFLTRPPMKERVPVLTVDVSLTNAPTNGSVPAMTLAIRREGIVPMNDNAPARALPTVLV